MNHRTDEGILDLGDPQQMVGHTGFTRGAGGGQCSDCRRIVAVLMDDHKCVRCTTQPVAGSPLGTDQEDASPDKGGSSSCRRK